MLDLTKRETVGNNWRQPLSKTSFDAAGLIALADLSTLAKRTALTGTSVYLDALLLCPGIHKQQTASELNKSELPPTAALNSGYVFRIENQATVAYLQSVGITGNLVTLLVETEVREGIGKVWTFLFGPDDSVLGVFLLLVTRILTVSGIVFMIVIEDWWGLALLLALVTARLFNIFVIRRRIRRTSWHGATEPGVMGDLLVLLSQDRWIRLQGPVDNLKAVTSGQFLGDMTFLENSLQGAATLIVYIGAALVSNATQSGSIIFIALLLISVFFLAICNHRTKYLHMHGHVIKEKQGVKVYKRRLDLANELIKETGRDDWALGLGMINAKDSKSLKQGKVTL